MDQENNVDRVAELSILIEQFVIYLAHDKTYGRGHSAFVSHPEESRREWVEAILAFRQMCRQPKEFGYELQSFECLRGASVEEIDHAVTLMIDRIKTTSEFQKLQIIRFNNNPKPAVSGDTLTVFGKMKKRVRGKLFID